MSIETINKRLKILSDLKDEMNKIKAVFDETLEEDPTYQKIQEETAKVKEETKTKKDRVMASSTIKDLSEQIKKLRDDMKENREILAQELADYYKDSGLLQITDTEGNTKRIIFSAKLVNS